MEPASLVAGPVYLPLVLLVDRDEDTRHMYAEFLRQSPCDIEEAEDGREALAKAIAHHPDIIVTETRLPGISGYDLCRLLRDDVLTRDIPIVVVTGDAFASDARKAEMSGADAVLVKPCLPERLAKTIERLMRESRHGWTGATALRTETGPPLRRALERSPRVEQKRVMLSRAYNRCDTTEPPIAPPALVCPSCDQPLRYLKSHVGGVSARHQEQWDYFECPGGCGSFQYRERTRKLRRVV